MSKRGDEFLIPNCDVLKSLVRSAGRIAVDVNHSRASWAVVVEFNEFDLQV